MISEYYTAFEQLLSTPAFSLAKDAKARQLLPLLNMLNAHHKANCTAYSQAIGDIPIEAQELNTLPYLAVRLFKYLQLQSIADQNVFRILRSSGTTSQTPAQVILDKETSARQSKVLVNVLQNAIGKARLPMLIIDSPEVLKKSAAFSARAAGIQGLMFFGRDHTYALDKDMAIDWPKVNAFCEKYQDVPVLLFGFTFMVWKYFIQAIDQATTQEGTVNLPKGILLHSGGWKKLAAQSVSNSEFKRHVMEKCGINRVINFYGMAEQVGSIFTECEYGHLHAPNFADVVIRDPYTLNPVKNGEQGLIQMLSVLPTSYPGHSILTEDLGRIKGEDDCPCGRLGKYIAIAGRLPKTEIRGCSDTHERND